VIHAISLVRPRLPRDLPAGRPTTLSALRPHRHNQGYARRRRSRMGFFPPAKTFRSPAGGAGLKGDRSSTFWPFWGLMQDLIAEGRPPRIIALENVCGTLTAHDGKDFAAICSRGAVEPCRSRSRPRDRGEGFGALYRRAWSSNDSLSCMTVWRRSGARIKNKPKT
jgi:hypothetical protein